MRSLIQLSILALPLAIVEAQTGNSDPGGVLRQLTVARFAGSGAESIQAITSDAAGNVYVAGTTSSADFPVRNAAQPAIGEAVLMRSSDRGLSWQKLPTPPVVPLTITPHPREAQTLFLGAADGIYRTTDSGRTWRHVYTWTSVPSSASSGSCCFNIAIDALHPSAVYTYTFGSATRFLASNDGGESWQVRNPPQAALLPGTSIGYGLSSARVLWVDPNGTGTVALGVWLSRDRGMTWARMAPLPMSTPTFTVPDPHHTGWIYAATSAGTSGHLYLSKDWGATWTERPSPMGDSSPEPVAIAIGDLLFDPDVPNTIYASDYHGYLYISDDAGASWHTPGRSASLDGLDRGVRPALLRKQCGGGAILGVSGTNVVSSLDFGTTWQPAQLSRVVDLATGVGCAAYVVRQFTADAFVAKLGPGGGEVLWSTFLGGSVLDATSAIALDANGNVYVAGNTSSADFPSTAPRSGPRGQQSGFAAKFDPEGGLIYSVVLGGERWDDVTSLAVNAEGEAHVVGWTNSRSFPTTPGAFQTEDISDGGGFAVKLGADGTTVYVSYVPNFAHGSLAVTIEASGSALIGGPGHGLSRMSPDGSSLTALPRQPGQIFAMETDGQGNIYVAGQVAAGIRSGPCFEVYPQPDGDIFLTKLEPDDLQPVFSTRLSGACRSYPRFLSVGPGDEVTLSLWTLHRFPLRNPALAVPLPAGGLLSGSAVIARLSADGSDLIFSSYVDTPLPAAIAVAPDSSIYAGVPSFQQSGHAGVLRIPVPGTGGPSVEGVYESFGGWYGYADPDTLVTITGQNMAPAFIDLGLNNPDPLPIELGGVRVLFDDAPAEMFQVAPDHVICVVPAAIAGKDSVAVQVIINSQMAAPFVLPVESNFGFLTHYFPALPPGGSVDGNIRNADGTMNDADHPAAPGSTVTLFANGLKSVGPSGVLWNAPAIDRGMMLQALPATVHRVPGFIHPLFAVDFRIPDAPGEGVYLVPTPGVLTRAEIGRVGSGLGVYVK